MGPMPPLLAGLVPDGPLHPELALLGVVAGVAAAVVVGRRERVWTLAVVAISLGAAQSVQGALLAGFLDRGDRVSVVGVTVAVTGVAVAARPRWSSAVVATFAAVATVWAVVPDTEVALLAASVLAGATLVRLLPGWLPDDRRRVNGVLVLLPAVSAAVGTIGRPSRYPFALVLVLLAAAGAVAAWSAGSAYRRGRAGTPSTVVSGATSSTTTAPAATTAP